MRPVLIAFIMLLSISHASAQDSARPYSFSGTCSSQGLWTQQAMQTTEQLRTFTRQLRDDANCRALGTQMQEALGKVEELVKPQVNENASRRLSQLRQEIPALRQFLVGGPSPFTAPVQSAMYKDQEEFAARSTSMISSSAGVASAEAGAELGGAVGGPAGAAAGAMAAGEMDAVGAQFARASREGLTIFNQVIDSMPAMQECLTDGGKVQAGQFLAGTVKLLTSFAASGQDTTGSALATSISKLTDMMRTQKFAKVLRNTNQTDFLASMSCLVEMTSENYCTTRDSQLLYNEMMKQLADRPPQKELSRIGLDNPLAGYYILTQNIPMITSWIQRLQIGVDPRLPTDAQFQNNIFDEVNAFYKQIKTIQGNLGYDIESMKSVQDDAGRRNQARQIISKLTGFITSNDSNGRNFFMLGGSPREIPFQLMGIDMPPEVKGIAGGGMPLDPEVWLQGNYNTHPVFKDPNALIATVQDNLKKMNDKASINAIAYYNKFFIVDKLSLVNESFLGSNYSVYDSLTLVDQYLAQVEKHVRDANQNVDLLPSIQDTRTRISNVLSTYAELRNLSTSLKSGNDQLSPDDVKKIEEANLKIVTSVYTEFQVMLGKSGWFANRVVKFVYADYLIQIKNKGTFGSSINDLFYATGLSIFDQLVVSAGGSPAKVQNDLSLALRLNKMNLESVEMLIRDYYAATTASLKAVSKASHGQAATYQQARAQVSIWDRAYREQKAILPGTNESRMSRITAGVMSAVYESMLNIPSMIPWANFGSWTATKYSYAYRNTTTDDEFGSARRLFEQFCIQSLAFNDVRTFYAMCTGSSLKSPFADNLLADLTPEQRQELTVSYDQKLQESHENAELNSSKRICAFRDYNRKNLVMYLTHDQAQAQNQPLPQVRPPADVTPSSPGSAAPVVSTDDAATTTVMPPPASTPAP